MDFTHVRLRVFALMLGLQVFLLFSITFAQSIQTTPYGSPSLMRGLSGQGVDSTPSNPLRGPGSSGPLALGGSDAATVSSGMFQGMLPPIPNLQLGYVYTFGSNYGAGRVTGDYLKPFSLTPESFLFGEAHVEGWNFWNSGGSTGYSKGFVNNRVDVSLGGGYRKFFGKQALIGINGFYDTTRLTGQWYSSGSLGLQVAWLLPGGDALDLNLNWYGQLLNSWQWVNAFRYGPSNYDFEAGYSHEIWNGGPDLRLKVKGYHFDVGSNLNGWAGGAELKSRDGAFVLRYEVGHDKLDQTYQTIGTYVNIGFQLENLLRAENPFTSPTPIFKSPRNLGYMASAPVSRSWTQPSGTVFKRSGDQTNGCSTPGYRVTGYVGNQIESNIKYLTSPLLYYIYKNTQPVTIYWCRVSEDVTVNKLTLWDLAGQKFESSEPFTIEKGDGMLTVNVTWTGEEEEENKTRVAFTLPSPPIQLDEGGALSVSY